MSSGITKTELDAVSGVSILLVSLSVDLLLAEKPHRNHSLVFYRECNIVGLIVDIDLDLQVRSRRNLIRIELHILLNAAHSHYCSQSQRHIFKNLHNLSELMISSCSGS